LQSEVVEVHCDLAKAQSIANELVANAIKFTDCGGIRVKIEEHGERWVLRVIDTGKGLEPHTARQIFGEIHNATPDPNAGARLGLVIARYLAFAMGRINLVAAPQKGSTFQVNLPKTLRPTRFLRQSDRLCWASFELLVRR